MKTTVKIKDKASKGGFTLIELMASIAIITVIAVIAVNRYNLIIANARAAKQATVISAIEKAKDLYVAEENRLTTELQSFNQKDAAGRLDEVLPYVRLNGVQPSSGSILLEGTGKSTIDPGKLATGWYSVSSGTGVITVPAEGGKPTVLN